MATRSSQSLRDHSSTPPPVSRTMTPTRRAPHCRTCHKPLKGHKRGVCDTTDIDAPDIPPSPRATPPRSASVKKPGETRRRKSAPLPVLAVPTLSPQSSQILNDLLRTNSHSAPPPIQVPGSKRTLRSASAGRDAESLHVALERLSTLERRKKSTTPSKSRYTPTEVEESDESVDLEEPLVSTQDSAFTVSQQLGLESSSETSTLAPHTKSTAAVSQLLDIQRHQSTASDTDTNLTIQNFLDSKAQSSHHPPATIFSFPANGVPALEDGAHRLGLFVHVLPLPSTDEDWVPVVVGRDEGAVKKLLEDSEELAQAVRKSGAPGASEFRVGMSHIVAGTLGALATWAGLAYT